MPSNKRFWEFRAQADENKAELLLYGDISDSSWWGDEVTPKQFAKDLNALGAVDEITVRINSGGGDVFAAQTIGNYLEAHSAKVTAHIDGLCASAATIIACHCDKVIAACDSTYMIHPVRMGLYGYVDADTLQKYMDALAAIKDSIISLYVKKTGREKDEITGWMDATSWWTSAQAKENGFVDELTDEGNGAVVEDRGGVLFVNSVSMNVPFSAAPKFVQDSLAAGPAASGFVDKPKGEEPEAKNHKEEISMEIKTVDDLRKNYPALVDQIEQAAAEAAVKAERQRIQDIEDMELPGSEAMTAEAKFTKPISAADYAKAVVKHAKTQGASYLEKAKDDAKGSGMGEVEPSDPVDKGNDEFLAAIRNVGKNQ